MILLLYINSFIAGAIKTFALLAQTVQVKRSSQIPEENLAIILAVAGAIKIKSEKAVEKIIDLLKNDDVEICMTAAWTLGDIGTEKAVNPLITQLKLNTKLSDESGG